MLGLIQDPQLTVEQSQMAVYDPDTQEVSPNGAASMTDWIKATVRSVYSEKEDCPSPPVNAEWSAQMKQLIGFVWNPCGTGFMMTGMLTC